MAGIFTSKAARGGGAHSLWCFHWQHMLMPRARKVLVVDDDPSITDGLSSLLRSENYLVRTALDGRRALATVRRFTPDVVLLDVNLPGLTGFEVCRQLRNARYAGAVIMLSARGEQADRITGLEAGADDYVVKPFDSREVLARVRAHVRRADAVPPQTRRGRGARGAGTRRLSAVMFTDMRDFAGHMHRDERRTMSMLGWLNAHIGRAASRHRGKIIEIIGDAFLISFRSALDAVACGLAVVRDLRRFNRGKSGDRRLDVRIGIHLGDVIEAGDKLRGDTVNIAARLQALASGTDVAVSGSVYEAVRDRLRMTVVDAGTRHVKHIRQAVRVYRLSP